MSDTAHDGGSGPSHRVVEMGVGNNWLEAH